MKPLASLLTSLFLLLLVLMGFLGISPVHADTRPVLYGTFLYAWYPSHWNGAPPAHFPSSWWNVTDVPFMGWYYSNDTQIIKEQFAFMHHAGINFVLISWWNDSETDNSALWIFQTMNNSLRSFGMKLAISIEPVNESGTYDFQVLRDYIYNRYILPFQAIYMELDGKPLLTWMQGGNMTNPIKNREAIYSDSNFTTRIIGDMDYVNWTWWFPNNGHPDQLAPKLAMIDGGQTTIEPRYDDSRLGKDPYSGQLRNTTYDPDYSQGQYQAQWDIAKAWIQKDECHIVLIGTWNDYTERTQIEPCFDFTSFTEDPFYLLNITRANVISPASTNTPGWLLIVSGVLGAIIASGIVTLYFLKVRKKS